MGLSSLSSSAMGQKPQKAKISKVGGSESLECQFNPTELETGWDIEWKERESIGNDVPRVTFAGGKAQELTLTFLFDSTADSSDVRDKYKLLLTLAQTDTGKENSKTGKSEPSECQFQWGKLLSFTAVIKSIRQKFTMFKSDGTPLRAYVTVVFKQAKKATGGQNPTTRTEPRKTWLVRQGDRLDWIAYQEYGNAAYWRYIAEANNLANPLDLQVGQVLKLVPLP